MNKVVIVGCARTPAGDYLGSLKSVSAVELGIIAVKGALEKANVKPEQVQEVVGGMIYKTGNKGNPARQVAIKSGIPAIAGAATVDQQCASAMRAFEIACQQIILGKTEISVAVGMESMTQAPYLLFKGREGYRMGDAKIYDSMLYDGLIDAFENYHMGMTAENLAEEYGISREEQDELALLSHQRAVAAQKAGKFDEEIVPVEISTRKGTIIVDKDEHPMENISMEKLSKLRPAFKKDGTITAGNASGINDGAAALVLMSEKKAMELGIKPIAEVLSTATYGVEPRIMGIGPAYAIPKALGFAGLDINDIDYFEINEAFAAQFIAVNRVLKLDMDKVNAVGSGISLGHPVGCTGIRIIVTLLNELKRRKSTLGLASLCVGGGPSMASVFKMM